ncbi:MAG TPA: response regulator [Chitinispirillaceae bacterium]|nr:response regulator [Chitinispirillaceae bacterium]
MRILIVDDDITSGLVMQKMLSRYGETTITTDGRQALETFKEHILKKGPFDLMFLDIMLPEMDGQEVLKNIRDFEEQNWIFGSDGIKIIMTTALDDNKNIMAAFRSQCEGYIVKPISLSKIRTQMQALGFPELPDKK